MNTIYCTRFHRSKPAANAVLIEELLLTISEPAMPSTTLSRVAHPSVLPLELTFDADPDSIARISPQQAVSSKDTVSLSGCSQSPTTSEFPLFRQSSSSTIDIAVQRLATTSSGKPSSFHSRARGLVQPPPLRPLPPPPTRPATHRSPRLCSSASSGESRSRASLLPSSIRTLVMESPGTSGVCVDRAAGSSVCESCIRPSVHLST